MMHASKIVKEIHAALEIEARLDRQHSTIGISTPGDQIVLDGEVPDIAAKRRVVACAKNVARGKHVVDHICVQPAERLGDGAIRDFVARHLLEDPVFLRTIIACRIAGDDDAISRQPDEPDGRIQVAVANGAATLSGHVQSLSHRRLAGVLAWWARGCRNVINELQLRPPQSDNDGELGEALELVLDKDPTVHSDQVTPRVRHGRVRVRGLVATEAEKRRVERDVWYVDGVHDVINELEVYRAPTGREPMPASPPQFE